jgi:hypothetical protein
MKEFILKNGSIIKIEGEDSEIKSGKYPIGYSAVNGNKGVEMKTPLTGSPDGDSFAEINNGQELDTNMVNELRNYHVKKLLNHLGGDAVAPYLQKAIKRSYSEFAEDVTKQKDMTHGHKSDNIGNS